MRDNKVLSLDRAYSLPHKKTVKKYRHNFFCHENASHIPCKTAGTYKGRLTRPDSDKYFYARNFLLLYEAFSGSDCKQDRLPCGISLFLS